MDMLKVLGVVWKVIQFFYSEAIKKLQEFMGELRKKSN